MSRSRSIPQLFIFILLLIVFLLVGQAACSVSEGPYAVQRSQSTIGSENLQGSSELIFAGQVIDANGDWQNGYVVVLFKNEEEIARTTTRLQESILSSEGPLDGVFELRIPNEYKIHEGHTFIHAANIEMVTGNQSGFLDTSHYVGAWLDELPFNAVRPISVLEKRVEYTVVVLDVPQDQLPESYLPGNLKLQGGILVTNAEGADATANLASVATAVPSPTAVPQSNIQFTVLPGRNNGLDWNLQLTGYYGNRWDVWETYVAGRGNGMSWETFKEAVLVHNPHLEADGFVFYPDKTYLLPFTQ